MYRTLKLFLPFKTQKSQGIFISFNFLHRFYSEIMKVEYACHFYNSLGWKNTSDL